MPDSKWGRDAPALTYPALCLKPPQPPLAPLPPWPPWLLAAVSLRYNLAEGVDWHVAGFTKLLPNTPIGPYTGQITRDGKTLAIAVTMTLAPPIIHVNLEGSTFHPPGYQADSADNPITPGRAWIVHAKDWQPGEPYQSADATITT